MGSLLPDSNSSKEAVLSFKFSFRERRIEKTEAASVEPITEPSNKPQEKLNLNANMQKSPTVTAVRTTPKVDKTIASLEMCFASFQLVPKPPENIIKINPKLQIFSARE